MTGVQTCALPICQNLARREGRDPNLTPGQNLKGGGGGRNSGGSRTPPRMELTPSQNLAIREGRDPNLTPGQRLGVRGGRVSGVTEQQIIKLEQKAIEQKQEASRKAEALAKTRTQQALRGRSEERRVRKECRSRWSPYHSKKKTTKQKIISGAGRK